MRDYTGKVNSSDVSGLLSDNNKLVIEIGITFNNELGKWGFYNENGAWEDFYSGKRK